MGTDTRTRPDAAVPGLFDASDMYRQMGFLVAGQPLPFVAAVRYLATPNADSTLAVVSVSLTNQALSFRRANNEFTADYHIEVSFRRREAGVPAAQVVRDATVRVGNFQETLRTDESVIFQHFVTLAPGDHIVSVLVRDRDSPNLSRVEQPQVVPRFAGTGLSSPLPIHEGRGRQRLDEIPRLLMNPRATTPYGGDSLRFYVEAYGLPRGARVAARAVDGADAVLWRDTISLGSGGPLARTVVAIVPSRLPLGRAQLELQIVGRPDTVRGEFLVSLSDRWVVTNLEQVAGLLRYFDAQDWVTKLRNATAEERPQVWREFWKATDPVPITPDNEALTEYFRRVQVANGRYREQGDAGWLTDRGEVYITLGEPDEALDLTAQQSRSGGRTIRWAYTAHRLELFFQDETGFGRFRLTPASRAEYQRVLARVRRTS